MKTFNTLMENIKTTLHNESRINDQGLYSCVTPDHESIRVLEKFCKRNFGVSAPDDIHCTVMYSTSSIDNDVAKQFSKDSYMAYPDHFEYWGGHDKSGYLVLKITSDDLTAEHQRLKDAGCTPTFDTYCAHITIITPIGADDAKRKVEIGNNDLDNIGFKIRMINQKLDILKL